jgi:hypothetical protein
MKPAMTKPLVEIGFSALESQVYVTLLQQSDLTGYRIAQILGKPVPNTYNALEALQKKGVVLSSRKGKSKRYSVLPVHDYLDQLESDFKAKRKRIERGLGALKPLPLQEGVYRIDNVEQFYQRATMMINGAKEVIAVDACPGPLEWIRAPLSDNSKGAARVIVKIYKTEQLPGCDTIVYDVSGTVFERWPVEWLHVFVDGREYVMGLFDKEGGGLLESVWSNSPYLSMMAYNGFMCEYVLSQLITMKSHDPSKDPMLERVEKYRPLFIQNLMAVDRFINAFGKSDQHDACLTGDD